MAKNAPKVPFATSTRQPPTKGNSCAAGPGGYDVVRGMLALSTAHKTVSDGSFATAGRGVGNGQLRLATSAGPGAYATEQSLDYTKPRTGKVPFPTAQRWLKAHNADYPAPRAYASLDKHVPHMPFPTGRGHDVPLSDPCTAAVPLRNCQRPTKHKPCASFGKAPRVL